MTNTIEQFTAPGKYEFELALEEAVRINQIPQYISKDNNYKKLEKSKEKEKEYYRTQNK